MSLEFIRKMNILFKKKNKIYVIIAIDEEFLEYNKEKID